MKTLNVFKVMRIVFWVIFIGLCIRTGTFLFSFGVSLFSNADANYNLGSGLDLSSLYEFGIAYYSIIMLTLIALSTLKAYVAYWTLRIFIVLKLKKPFSEEINNLLLKISRLSLLTGAIGILGEIMSRFLSSEGITIPIYWANGEILFFGAIIFLIAQIFNKGVELQSESELTI